MDPILTRGSPFDKPGNWYKGAIHFHTTNTDGRLSPDEAVAFFKHRGYDFICPGDHWYVTVPSDAEGRLLVIPGCELDTWQTDSPGNTHIMCMGVTLPPGDYRPVERPTHRAMWDFAKSISAYRILNHPYWSTRSPEFIKSYDGLDAIEVYNHKSERDYGMGFAEYTWHMLLNEGFFVDALAADDGHKAHEFGHAWVMVRAEAYTQEGILAAMKNGDFYSTMGPEIRSVAFADGRIHVTTSPARKITFRTTQFFGGTQIAPDGGELTEAGTAIDLDEMEWVRVEVEDHEGRKAWSNPLHFRNSQVHPPIRERTVGFA